MSINPIIAKATIETVGRDREDAAEAREDDESRAALDGEELRELEHAEYYGGAPTPSPAAPPPARRRSLLDRLLRR